MVHFLLLEHNPWGWLNEFLRFKDIVYQLEWWRAHGGWHMWPQGSEEEVSSRLVQPCDLPLGISSSRGTAGIHSTTLRTKLPMLEPLQDRPHGNQCSTQSEKLIMAVLTTAEEKEEKEYYFYANHQNLISFFHGSVFLLFFSFLLSQDLVPYVERFYFAVQRAKSHDRS